MCLQHNPVGQEGFKSVAWDLYILFLITRLNTAYQIYEVTLYKTNFFCFWEKVWFTNIIFAREQKCIINHSGLGIQRRNGSD